MFLFYKPVFEYVPLYLHDIIYVTHVVSIYPCNVFFSFQDDTSNGDYSMWKYPYCLVVYTCAFITTSIMQS